MSTKKWTNPRRARCASGKVRYRDRIAADLGAQNVARSSGSVFRSYRCPGCGGWHLSSRRR